MLQDFYSQEQVEPRYYDAQNVDAYSVPGTIRLCAKCQQIDSQASDRQYLLYPFGTAVYRLPTANFVAAEVQKATQATGAPSWSALANVYPGAVAGRGAVIWRDQWIVASGDTVLRVMSTAEVWTTIAAPAGLAAPISGQVGVSNDDKLLVWWEGTAGATGPGLWSYDGTNWTKVYPPSGVTAPVAGTCDFILRGPGSALFATRDTGGVTRLYEYISEPTGTAFRIWLEQPGLRFWPQSAFAQQDAAYLVGRLGNQRNRGILYRKTKDTAPEIVAFLDTNKATDGLEGQDWAWRCVFSAGDILWIGGSSRYDRKACLYRVEVYDQDEVIHPTAVLNVDGLSVDGPLYSIAMLPYAAAGASSTDRIFISGALGTFYKDADNVTDAPLGDAASGFVELPRIDYGTPDDEKLMHYQELGVMEKSTGGVITPQYRVDPTRPSAPWSTLVADSSRPLDKAATAEGVGHYSFPHDNEAQGKYGLAVRTMHSRLQLSRASSGTKRDVIETIAFVAKRIKPPAVP